MATDNVKINPLILLYIFLAAVNKVKEILDLALEREGAAVWLRLSGNEAFLRQSREHWGATCQQLYY
jgi:hypothetical protein